MYSLNTFLKFLFYLFFMQNIHIRYIFRKVYLAKGAYGERIAADIRYNGLINVQVFVIDNIDCSFPLYA